MFVFRPKTIGLTLAILTTLSVVASARDLVPWVDDLAQAQQLAADSNKLLIVHFWDHNCPPCSYLEKEVFSQPIFGHTLSQHYVPVKINVSASPDISRRFQVSQWPMDIILTPDGKVQHKMVSPRIMNEYLRTLTEVAWRSNDAMRTAGIQSPGYADAQQPASSLAGTQGLKGLMLKQDLQRAQHQEQNSHSFAAIRPAAMAHGPGKQQAQGAFQLVQNHADLVVPSQQPGAQPSLTNAPPQMVENAFFRPREGHDATRQPSMPPRSDVSSMVENRFVGKPAAPNQPTEASGTALNGPMSLHSAAAAGDPTQRREATRGPESSDSVAQSYVTSTDREQNLVPPKSSVSMDDSAPALDGHCPVALSDRDEWVRGDHRWGARHRGQTFMFHSAAAQQRFLADPDEFSPRLAGFDPVIFSEQGQFVQGERAHGVRYKGQMYLFESEQNLAKFWSTPQKYAQVIQQAMLASDRIQR